MLQTRINAGFTKYFCLFKLNYNYCNTRNTRKSLQKTKVLLPDVLFRQAIAPLSYFILFLQIGVSHQRFIYRLRSFSAFADCPYYQGLTSVHISCCENPRYAGLIGFRFVSTLVLAVVATLNASVTYFWLPRKPAAINTS